MNMKISKESKDSEKDKTMNITAVLVDFFEGYEVKIYEDNKYIKTITVYGYEEDAECDAIISYCEEIKKQNEYL